MLVIRFGTDTRNVVDCVFVHDPYLSFQHKRTGTSTYLCKLQPIELTNEASWQVLGSNIIILHHDIVSPFPIYNFGIPIFTIDSLTDAFSYYLK